METKSGINCSFSCQAEDQEPPEFRTLNRIPLAFNGLFDLGFMIDGNY